MLQYQEVDPILMSDVMQGADMRMAQRGDGARLALEALPRTLVGAHVRRQYLDRDRAIQPGIPSLVDLTHPARADEQLNLVDAEPITHLQCVDAPALALSFRLAWKSVQELERRTLRETAGLLVTGQERFDLGQECLVVAAQLAGPRPTLTRRKVQDRLKHLLDPIPVGRVVHAGFRSGLVVM